MERKKYGRHNRAQKAEAEVGFVHTQVTVACNF